MANPIISAEAVKRRRRLGSGLSLAVLVLVLLLLLLYLPLAGRGFTWAIDQGDQELAAVQTARAETWYQLAHSVEPWNKTATNRLNLAAQISRDLSAGRQFLAEHGNVQAVETIDLLQVGGAADPVKVATELAGRGYPVQAQAMLSIHQSEHAADIPYLLLLAHLAINADANQTTAAASYYRDVLRLDPDNMVALQALSQLGPTSAETARLTLLSSLGS